MYSAIRPTGRRLLSVRPNASLFVARSRSIATQSISFSRPATALTVTSFQQIQRRWNSEDATRKVAEKFENAKATPMAESKAKAEAFIEEAAMNAASDRVSTVTATETEISVETPAAENNADVAAASISDNEASPSIIPQEGRKEMLESNITPKETIYIGNLFFDVTAEDLKARMESFGVVERCSIIHDTRGLSKGFGYVTFDSVDAAQRAVNELNQQVFEGRRVIVQFAASTQTTRAGAGRSARKPTRSLYIGNLSYNMSDRELNDLFKSVRNVIEVRIAVDRQTGQPRGFAHADFLDVPSAQAAFELLSSKAPHGRRLRIDFSEGVRKPRRTENPTEQQEGEN